MAPAWGVITAAAPVAVEPGRKPVRTSYSPAAVGRSPTSSCVASPSFCCPDYSPDYCLSCLPALGAGFPFRSPLCRADRARSMGPWGWEPSRGSDSPSALSHPRTPNVHGADTALAPVWVSGQASVSSPDSHVLAVLPGNMLLLRHISPDLAMPRRTCRPTLSESCCASSRRDLALLRVCGPFLQDVEHHTGFPCVASLYPSLNGLARRRVVQYAVEIHAAHISPALRDISGAQLQLGL